MTVCFEEPESFESCLDPLPGNSGRKPTQLDTTIAIARFRKCYTDAAPGSSTSPSDVCISRPRAFEAIKRRLSVSLMWMAYHLAPEHFFKRRTEHFQYARTLTLAGKFPEPVPAARVLLVRPLRSDVPSPINGCPSANVQQPSGRPDDQRNTWVFGAMVWLPDSRPPSPAIIALRPTHPVAPTGTKRSGTVAQRRQMNPKELRSNLSPLRWLRDWRYRSCARSCLVWRVAPSAKTDSHVVNPGEPEHESVQKICRAGDRSRRPPCRAASSSPRPGPRQECSSAVTTPSMAGP